MVAAQPGSGIAFNGHAVSHKINWGYSQGTIRETKVSRLGIGWSEQLAPYLSGGIQAGYLDISQASNPIEAGKVLDGHYFGINLKTTPVDLELLQLQFNLDYIYNSAESVTTDQTVEFVWHNTVLTTQLDLNLLSRLTLILGGKLSWVDGEERTTGNTTQVISFSEKERGGYYAGFDFATDPSGNITLLWEGGTQSGISIFFRRRF
jgi:hypothetical protein